MYHIRPQWYFSSEAMEIYMKIASKKWTTHDVGTKVEAFAIAGCDIVSKCVPLCPWKLTHIYYTDLVTTSKKKADYLKAEIRNKISEMLSKRGSYFELTLC
jgi:hypothetical protein